MRRNASFLLSLIFMFTAFWMGEGGSFLVEPAPIAIAAAGCIVVSLLFPGTLLKKSLIGALCLFMVAASYFTGAYSYNRAFIECVHQGEKARVQLQKYYAGNRQYPEKLSQVDGPLPGERILRPTILKYRKTKEGYELTFEDWLSEFRATQSEPFLTGK